MLEKTHKNNSYPHAVGTLGFFHYVNKIANEVTFGKIRQLNSSPHGWGSLGRACPHPPGEDPAEKAAGPGSAAHMSPAQAWSLVCSSLIITVSRPVTGQSVPGKCRQCCKQNNVRGSLPEQSAPPPTHSDLNGVGEPWGRVKFQVETERGLRKIYINASSPTLRQTPTMW